MQNIKLLIFSIFWTTTLFAQDYHLTLTSQRDGLSNATITGIAQGDNNYIWLSSPYGLNRFDGHSVRTYFKKDGLVDNTLLDVYFDDNKLLWIDTKKGIQTYNGHKFKTITNPDSLEIPQFKSNRIVDYNFLLNQPFSSRITDTLTYKSKLYVATFGEGLWVYEEGTWLEIDNKLGLFDITITDLFKDSNEQFWIASNHGLTLFSESEFQIAAFDTIKNSFGMLEYENALWICSRNGIDKIEDETSTRYSLEEGANFMLNINTNHKNKLQSAGIGGHLYEWNGTDFNIRRDFNKLLEGQFVYDIESHNNKTYYACGGVILVDDGKQIITFKHDSIGGMSYDLLSDSSNLWIANSEGLIRISSEGIKRASIENGMSDDNTRTIENDSFGNLWIGTYAGGLLKFNGDYFTTYNINNGLNDELIKSLKWDEHRNGLWVGTNNGLHFLNTDSIGEVTQIEMFAEPTGYPFKYCHNKALLLKNNGTLLFAANTNDQTNEEHIFSLSGTTKSKKSFAPIVQLESFKVNTKRLENLELTNWVNFPLNPTLNYTQNQFNFQFNATHFTAGNYIEYQWYLEGLEDDWQAVSTQNNTNYTNLNSGDYTLYLRAKVPNSNWSEEQKYSFTIKPPIWNTWWFILFGSLILIYIIVFITKRRQKEIHQKQLAEIHQLQQKASLELSALRAQFNPHFVFNVLNSIQGIILCEEPEKAIIYLNDFSRLMRMILNNSRKNLIKLNDEIDFIKKYISLEQLRFEDKFEVEYIYKNNYNPAGSNVPPLLLQPYVENAIKHGLLNRPGGGKLTIEFEDLDNAIQCTIIDNGVGRKIADQKKTKSYTSKGLTMMNERIEYLNTAYSSTLFSHTIDDLNTEEKYTGTKVVLKFPKIIKS